MENQRVTAIKTGPENSEVVCIETLLMKLSLAASVMSEMSFYIRRLEDGDPGDILSPDEWAIAGAMQNLDEVKHALKAACWGYKEVYRH